MNNIDQNTSDKIILHDTTLRDGAQTFGVDFTLHDKKEIAKQIASLGIDFIEAGWPGANETDTRLFQEMPEIMPLLGSSKVTAFGMTKKKGISVSNDPQITALLNANVKYVTLVGKSSVFQVENILNMTKQDNLNAILQTLEFFKEKNITTIFDAEHFFDGFKENPQYTIEVLKIAVKADAKWIVLCDTNGATLPHEVFDIVTQVTKHIDSDKLSIHCHDDTGNAVANSLEAVRAGVRNIQGTVNGLGERCGNANLITLIPVLKSKMNYQLSVSEEQMKRLTQVSNFVNDLLNRSYNSSAPFVGQRAFAHKGGLHASAVRKNTSAYEMIDPELVGNKRIVVVSNQAGRSNLITRLKEINLDIDMQDEEMIVKLDELVEKIKHMEFEGYSFDIANASFAVLAAEFFNIMPNYYKLEQYRAIDERRINATGKEIVISEAKIKLFVDDKETLSLAEGIGPVDALSKALIKAVADYYPEIAKLNVTDYKVRIINCQKGSDAYIRVLLEMSDSEGNRWYSTGVSYSIIEASYKAIRDSILYYLYFIIKLDK